MAKQLQVRIGKKSARRLKLFRRAYLACQEFEGKTVAFDDLVKFTLQYDAGSSKPFKQGEVESILILLLGL